MKIILEAEQGTVEASADFYPRRTNLRDWAIRTEYGFWIQTPLFAAQVDWQGWFNEKDPYRPKWSRPKRASVTVEYGNIPGYKDS